MLEKIWNGQLCIIVRVGHKKKRIVGLESFDFVKSILIYCCLLGVEHLKNDILAYTKKNDILISSL